MIWTLSMSGAAFAQSVDLKKSEIKWSGSAIGKSHWGVIGIKEAKLETNKANEPVSSRIVVDMAKIEVKDLEGDNKKALTDHLSSPDFFDVANHKEAVFVANKFTKESTEKNGDVKYKVDGQLTIRDKTNPESLVMIVKPSKKSAVVTGELVFDRTKYDVKYNSTKATNYLSLAKDKLINDQIDLKIALAVNTK